MNAVPVPPPLLHPLRHHRADPVDHRHVPIQGHARPPGAGGLEREPLLLHRPVHWGRRRQPRGQHTGRTCRYRQESGRQQSFTHGRNYPSPQVSLARPLSEAEMGRSRAWLPSSGAGEFHEKGLATTRCSPEECVTLMVMSIRSATAIPLLGRACVGLFAFWAGRSAAAAPAESDVTATFARDVRPLLVDHCYDCHAEGSKKGGISFDDAPSDASLVQNVELWSKA